MLVMTLRTVTVVGALALMFLLDDVVGRGSLGGQAFVQPAKRRHDFRVLIAQPLDQLNGEGGWQRYPIEGRKTISAGSPSWLPTPSKPVGQRIGQLTRGLRTLTMSSARRRKFSTSTIRSVMATAQSSPIVNGCTR